MSAPNGRLRQYLSRHCSAATMERLVDPILTDTAIEARAAAFRGQQWTGRWIRAAGAFALVKALALFGWSRFWSIREWPVDERRAVIRSMAYAFVVTCAGVKLLMLPPLLSYPLSRYQELALYLVPQAFPIALPVGLLLGLLYGFRSSVASLRSRILVTVVAIACSVLSLVAVAWVVPASNQAFRVAALRDSRIPKGLNELTLGELRSRIDVNGREGRDVARISMTYHARLALAASPVVLTAWAFLLIGRLPNRGRWLFGIVAIASCVAYASFEGAGRMAVFRETLPPAAGAWLPNSVFAAAIILLGLRSALAEPRTTNANDSPTSSP